VLVTGSFLIEFIFDINGMGLLGYTSVVDRDYPTVMGVLIISSVLILIGNILSDVLVALIDPRIRFK
jgi:microcin C transport system permease protein